jgi:hypothetical protein
LYDMTKGRKCYEGRKSESGLNAARPNLVDIPSKRRAHPA